MPVQVVATPYGARALDALGDLVRGVKAADPMAPVTLLVPNNIAGIVARRHLARGLGEGRHGVAGIHIATLPRLAEQLAAARLAPRRPATSPILSAAWRAALDGDPSVFDTVKGHPATIRALLGAHRELRDLTPTAMERVAAASALTRDLVRLHRSVVAAVAKQWYDPTDLLLAAASRVAEAPSVAAELGRLVLYLPQELTLAETGFARVLAERAELTVLLGRTGVDRADRAVRRSLTRMGVSFDAGVGRAPIAHEVLHASDSDDEVRCVVRDVVATLAIMPAHRVAILYGAPHPYSRLLHEHLAAAGITVNGAGTRPVIERAIGRGFLDVLALADRDLPRADFFTAVSEAPTRTFDGGRVPASRWERLSRSAAVVSGDDWADRLSAHAAAVARELEEERERDDPYQSRIERYQGDLDGTTALLAFATALRDRLRDGRALTTWSSLSGWASGLFRDLYGDAQALAQLPAEEQYAAVAVESVLGGLGELDAFEPTADLNGLIDVLSLELEAALLRVGRFGEGMLVAPLSASIGLDADVVYVVGLAEDSYPGRLGEDALLLEQVRDSTEGELASYRDRLDAMHRHLLAAYDAAPRVVGSFPRGDLRRSTHRLPSRWLLHTLRALAGDDALAATEWESVRSDALSGSASYASSLTRLAMPATEQEWRTRAAAAGTGPQDPVVDSAIELVRARASTSFTRYDGNLAGVGGLPDYADGRRLVSPTALETYASCPHAYLVERLLRVSPVEQPEETISISPLDIGSLMHETMDAFITECAESLPGFGEPWTAAHGARLREIAVATAADFQKRGSTGHRRLWQTERDRILADLDYMLDNDNERRASRDARVLGSELSFGRDGADPVSIAVERGTVLMRGSADKVDEARDGTLVVVDVKTGGTKSFAALKRGQDRVAEGTKLQLPVYAHAALQLLGGSRAEAAYWFVRQGKRDWIAVELDAELEAIYATAVGTLVNAIAGGMFPAKAPEQADFGWVQCRYCDPDGLGHGDARTRWERKRHDPVLRALVALVDPGVLEVLGGPPAPAGGRP